jgi:O-antigen/teichoic acid export membrane protein
VAEALARDDHPWARSAARRLYLLGSGFALCSAIGLWAVGPWVLQLWLGADFANVSRVTLGCYGLYFVAHVWRHLNHTLMIGTGQVGKLVRIQLLESATVAILASVALHYGGIPAMFATMAVVILAMTGSVLPGRVARALRG